MIGKKIDANPRLEWLATHRDEETDLAIAGASTKPTFSGAVKKNFKAVFLEDLPLVFGQNIKNKKQAMLGEESPQYSSVYGDSIGEGLAASFAGLCHTAKDLIWDPSVLAAHKLADLVNPKEGKNYDPVSLSEAAEP